MDTQLNRGRGLIIGRWRNLNFLGPKSELIVLSGDSGSSLAFAPGWNTKSAKPGEQGVTVISGHRDTHFNILKDTAIGDSIVIVTAQGVTVNYQVETIDVVDSRVATIKTEQSGQVLVLVTCYPFDVVVAGGPLRYVVTADEFYSELN